MTDGALLDRLLANAWPPAVDEHGGGWRDRWTGGVTRRANAALAIDGHGDLDELVARAESCYGARHAPTTIHVSTASAPTVLGAYLAAAGDRSTARPLVGSPPPPRWAGAAASSSIEVELAGTPSDEWFQWYWSVESERDRQAADLAISRDVLLAPPAPSVVATAYDGADVIGVGHVVIESGRGGVQRMTTGRAHRGRGAARVILGALAAGAVAPEVRRRHPP